MKTNESEQKRRRVTVTLPDEDYQRLCYWAQKRDCSINEYLYDAIQLAIRWENGDCDVERLGIQRLNQLIDALTVLSSNVGALEAVVTSGFDSLLGLTHGDNYLLEDMQDG